MSIIENAALPVDFIPNSLHLSEEEVNAAIETARSLGEELHAGQWYDEECGLTYFEGHLAPVVEIGDMLCRLTGRSRLVAGGLWLHDTVEDTPATLPYLQQRGVISPILSMTDYLTKRPGEGNWAYLRRLAPDPYAALGKLADSMGNGRVNLQFHSHESPRKVRKRLLKYPGNMAYLAPIVLGESIEATEDLNLAGDPEATFDAFVGALCDLRSTLSLNPETPPEIARRQILTHPQRVAFLAPLILGDSVQPEVITNISRAVRERVV